MKEHDEQIENNLKVLGELLRAQPSVTKKGMRTIEQAGQIKSAASAVFLPPLVKSGIGIAACLLIGLCLWFSIAGPVAITLADVQKSIESKTWVLIRYERGAQEWANLPERRSFYSRQDEDGRNFYAGMRDHVNGIWRYYHSNHGEQIHERTFSTRPYPQTPWEYAVGDWDDFGFGQFAHRTVEKSTDTIDGRQVVRFDSYNVGPLGIRSLAQQVWADPDTRLPMRIRKYSGPQENNFDTGDFSFPQTGPSSIYDLGAPEGLPVVENWGVIEPAAKAVIDAAKEALRQLPRKMRIIEKSKYELSISYCYDGKFRRESYGKTDANHNSPLPIEAPESNHRIREWALNNLTLVDLCIFDGEYEYSYNSGEGLWDSSEGRGASLSIRDRGPDWIDALVPIRKQWPYITNVGPMWVLEDELGTPPGCVLLRYEEMGKRRDWYVDPERDYICVKRFEFDKDKDTDEWVEDEYWRAEWTDLTRLPLGQWYAKSKAGDRVTTETEIELLTDSDMELLTGREHSAGFFDGERLLKNAMDDGAKVTFWAR
ncbi:MAG TPA: hypothetical protein VMX13_07245 [Sedimentisphaerales bacterium]|nr:hypothetical protein [Sedimentisphaerales bacterium]